jgi:hypothetical protein
MLQIASREADKPETSKSPPFIEPGFSQALEI